ncbi:MAG: flagellar basal body rod protein FlgB [Alphaproteobacteria bacterium]
MSSSVPGLFDLLQQKMSYLNQKQGVLAENVANADTPGYKQLELKPFAAALQQASIGMTVTDPRHIVPASMAGVNAKSFASKGTEVSPTGNSVDIEDQMMEVSKTAMDYQSATSMYHKMIGLLKIAIKGSST